MVELTKLECEVLERASEYSQKCGEIDYEVRPIVGTRTLGDNLEDALKVLLMYAKSLELTA